MLSCSTTSLPSDRNTSRRSSQTSHGILSNNASRKLPACSRHARETRIYLIRGSVLREWWFLKCAVNGQRSKEVQQVFTLLRQDPLWLQVFLVEILIRLATGEHNIDRLFQRLRTAVMEIRRRLCNVSQCRRFEGARVFRFLRKVGSATVRRWLVHPDTDIVILLIGE